MLRILALLTCLSVAFGASRVPRPVPSVPVNLTNGKKLDIAKEYKGKVVFLALVSTTCEDCLNLSMLLGRLQKEFGPKGLQTVAVACEPDSNKLAGPWEQRYRPGVPVGYYSKAEMYQMAELAPDARPYVPVLLVIDRSGKIKYQMESNEPIMKETEKLLRVFANSLLAEKP